MSPKLFDLCYEFSSYINFIWRRTRLPVTWGNFIWYDFDKTIVTHGRLSRLSRKRIDYSSLPGKETAHMLRDDYPHHLLRKRFNDQIIKHYLDDSESLIRPEPICIITSGGTASGKTSAVDTFEGLLRAENIHFLRIDYDAIKKYLPEYIPLLTKKIKGAAEYVHFESIKIGGRIFKKSHSGKLNVIYEKSLEDLEKTKEDIKRLRKKGYKIAIIATHVKSDEGLRRAEKRFAEGGRYVPPEKISERYEKVPKTLFEIRNKVDQILLFDNNGQDLRLMFHKNEDSRVITNHNLYNEYLSIVGPEYDLTML